MKAISIFGKVGREKKLAECIEALLNIVISEIDEDGCESKVCCKCQELLKKFYNFKSLALKTQEQFQPKNVTKRCSKSPLAAESEKRSWNFTGADNPLLLSSKRLGFGSSGVETTSKNKKLTNSATFSEFGLNNKTKFCVNAY